MLSSCKHFATRAHLLPSVRSHLAQACRAGRVAEAAGHLRASMMIFLSFAFASAALRHRGRKPRPRAATVTTWGPPKRCGPTRVSTSLSSSSLRPSWPCSPPPNACSQMLGPPQSLHLLLMRPCSQMSRPPQSLHPLLWRLWSQTQCWCPRSPCIGPSGGCAGRCWRPRSRCTCS